jgi:putative PIN family toxin of toxin-antitoxin system
VTPRVVFDCGVLLQAAGSPTGPAARCAQAIDTAAAILCLSDAAKAEVWEVLDRPNVRKKFRHLTDERVAEFRAWMERVSVRIDPVPALFTLTRDPDDSQYLNLAIAAGATLVVSRDNDLLDLMTGTDSDAVTFRTSYPEIVILDPAAFLRIVRTAPPPSDPLPPNDTPDPPPGSPSNGN